jgi:hypothetical protein
MRPRSSWTQEPSKFTPEERREWKQWLDDPKSTSFERDAGSRARPVSFAARTAKAKKKQLDEDIARMVARGVISK